MRKITLYSPHVDRRGRYHDAGSVLTVGAADNAETDIETATADRLIEEGRAVSQTDARKDAGAADPLDHNGDGKAGGSKPAQ